MARAKKRTTVETAAALAATSEADVKKTLDQLNDLQVSVQGTLAGVGVSMATKIEELTQLETAISARKDELKEIHSIEMDADTLANIKQQIEEEEERAAETAAATDKAFALRRSEQDQEWQRRGEEHAYAQGRRLERIAAEADDARTTAQRAEAVRTEDVNRDLAARVAVVAEREEKAEELQTKVDGIEDLVATAAKEATDAATKTLTAGFGHERALLKKDAESAAQLAAATITNLTGDVQSLQTRIEMLADQLATAQKDAKDVATAAVEASSNRQALSTLQAAVETQARAAAGGRGR